MESTEPLNAALCGSLVMTHASGLYDFDGSGRQKSKIENSSLWLNGSM
ncbi:MAG TPA: hypothetical protein VN249_01390 [Prolixibacteraceae bacterium]|nr:hypothetical protein [Prolixibacteraceae bacterium]